MPGIIEHTGRCRDRIGGVDVYEHQNHGAGPGLLIDAGEGGATLDTREVAHLAETLDEWLQGRGYQR